MVGGAIVATTVFSPLILVGGKKGGEGRGGERERNVVNFFFAFFQERLLQLGGLEPLCGRKQRKKIKRSSRKCTNESKNETKRKENKSKKKSTHKVFCEGAGKKTSYLNEKQFHLICFSLLSLGGASAPPCHGLSLKPFGIAPTYKN